MKPPLLSPLWSKHKARIETCQRIIGYRFKNQRYIREALTIHGSLHKRLALVGDRAADLQLVARWYDNKDHLERYQWTLMKAALLNNKRLAEVGLRLRIHECTLSPCDNSASMATTIEAILGAVWYDSSHDFVVVSSLVDRLGLMNHALLRPAHTADQLLGDIRSSRSLPARFFVGHHLGLLQLLFKHSHSFVLQQQSGQHSSSNLSRHEPARYAVTGRLLGRLWSRIKRVLPAPNHVSEMVHRWNAAPAIGKNEHHGQGPSSVDAANLPDPKQDGSANTLAADEQTSVNPHDPGPGSSLAGGHEGPTGWHEKDTEWKRMGLFMWSVGLHLKWKGRRMQKRAEQTTLQTTFSMLDQLARHRKMLRNLPERSLKSMPSDFRTDSVYLMTEPADEVSDRSFALQAMLLQRQYHRLRQKWERRRRAARPARPEELEDDRTMRLVRTQLAKVWRARLELWLPPEAQAEAQEHRVPTSLPNSGHTSATSSETRRPGLPVTAAVDSTNISNAAPAEDKRPHKPGSVLWTNAVQHQSVDWKQYLRKPTTQNE